MFKEMGVKTFYIGKSLNDPQRENVIFQGSENVTYYTFMRPETKPIVEFEDLFMRIQKKTRGIS